MNGLTSLSARNVRFIPAGSTDRRNLLILRDGEVRDGRECTDMVYAEAEG
jgi:hypothetical protein